MSERWPRLFPQPAFSGVFRSRVEDFFVEEIPAYPPTGIGTHLMVEIEKRNLTTEEVVRALSKHLSIRPDDIGVAGLKDRQAVTRQWISVPAIGAERILSFQQDGVTVLQSALHGNKLKSGHLKGNRFKIMVRDLTEENKQQVIRRCQDVHRYGVPNYFGYQRFGKDGRNETEGLLVLQGKGKRHDRRSLRFVLSAAQSALFNDILAQRIRKEWFHKVLEGDILVKADSGGMFWCEEPEIDQPRMDAFLVHPTGPMFGPKMKVARGQPGAMEQEVVASFGLNENTWRKFSKLTSGTRRALRLALTDLNIENQPEGLLLSFSLPAGGYATSVLRELILFEGDL